MSCVLLGTVVGAPNTQAQTQTGIVEAAAQGAVFMPVQDTNRESTGYLVVGRVGYFVTDALQVAIAPQVYGNFKDTPSGALTGRVDYHLLPESTTVPFVGVQGGVLFSSSGGGFGGGGGTDTNGALGGQAGVKVFLTKTTSVNAELDYIASTDAMDEGALLALFGVSYYFR
ncbi:MAG: outer membrane beta-barrel protein [Deltaproteobacteria bacterium]|nr:outer membrane beta-barrel protein [Deltaproteobacteria bacterium]